MLYALLHNNKILGLYSNLTQCKLMQQGLIQNNFTNQEFLTILSYHDNSMVLNDTKIDGISENSDNNVIEDFSEENTSTKEKTQVFIATDELNSSMQKKVKKQRNKQSKIEYNMALIKQKKEKLEESKNIYKTDFELFKKFKKIKKDTPSFEIPELFQNKFNLMLELEEKNNLSWETFISNYVKEKIDTSHSMLFAIDNNMTNNRELLEISSSEKDVKE